MDIHAGIPKAGSVYSCFIDYALIRLLRFWQLADGVFVGKRQTFLLASALHFYTASCVWGNTRESGTSTLVWTGSSTVMPSLVPFVQLVTNHNDPMTGIGGGSTARAYEYNDPEAGNL
jgi:hypothetical protein